MSDSAKLSETHTRDGGGRSMFNANAKQHERKLQESVLKIKSELESMYPELKFTYRKKLYLSEIVEKLGKTFTPESKKPYVNPDGGLLFIEWNGTEYPILISEAKKQGTLFFNEDGTLRKKLTKKQKKLALSGKKQGRGNAFERAYKNIEEFKLYCEDLDYFPYILFACGKDFECGSSILDRLDAMTRYEPRNINYVADSKQKVTAYVQKKYFTANEMFENIYDVAKTSLKCIGV